MAVADLARRRLRFHQHQRCFTLINAESFNGGCLMRRGLAIIAAICGAFWCGPAAAQQTVSTSATLEVYDGVPLNHTVLAPFDTHSGALKLTGITLTIDGSTEDGWFAFFSSMTSGPINVTVPDQGVFDAFVNGVEYQFPITGTGTVIVPASGSGSADLKASGTATFNLDPSLFSSFTNPSVCGFSQLGICVYGQSLGVLPDSPVPGVRLAPGDTLSSATYTIVYSFNSVPEPSTWAMLLLGFAAIGFRVWRERKLARGAAMPVPTRD